MKLVELQSVSKTYKMGDILVSALCDVSLEIDKGDFLAFTGPSGSGKTTLLNLIGCMDLPSSGKVLIDGTATDALGEKALDALRSRSIGMIFQSFNLMPVLNVRENLALPLQLQRIGREEHERRIDEALNWVGLERYASFMPDRLSGGQRQRVAIARALVARPKLILADEPTASLDSANALSLVKLMRHLNVEHGVTFVFSTHDDRLLDHVDDVREIRDGRLQPGRVAARQATSGVEVS
jgi:putative ABC transport system ATP-binding protein